ncbi:TPA: hypothetical protein N0F65_005568, partial [Lagenidium giganteum]
PSAPLTRQLSNSSSSIVTRSNLLSSSSHSTYADRIWSAISPRVKSSTFNTSCSRHIGENAPTPRGSFFGVIEDRENWD